MKCPPFEKSVKGFFVWLKWKVGLLMYLLSAALPVAMYLLSLLVLAIERRSTIVLPISMTLLLHPAVTLPIGLIAQITGKYLSDKLFGNPNIRDGDRYLEQTPF